MVKKCYFRSGQQKYTSKLHFFTTCGRFDVIIPFVADFKRSYTIFGRFFALRYYLWQILCIRTFCGRFKRRYYVWQIYFSFDCIYGNFFVLRYYLWHCVAECRFFGPRYYLWQILFIQIPFVAKLLNLGCICGRF